MVNTNFLLGVNIVHIIPYKDESNVSSLFIHTGTKATDRNLLNLKKFAFTTRNE